MSDAYDAWIRSYVASVGGPASTYGKCGAATASMVEAFPELRAVRGHVDTDYGRRSHWWCTTAAGEILDPTAGQFRVIFEYIEFEEGDPERLGSCMNCGREIWAPRNRDVCTAACSRRCGDSLQEDTGGEPMADDKHPLYVADTQWNGADDE